MFQCSVLSFYRKMNERDRRAAMFALFQNGDKPSAVIQKLGLQRNQRKTVYYNYKRYQQSGSTERKKQKKSRASEKRKKAVKCIREKIRRNPARSQRKLASANSVSQTTVHRIIKEDLHMSAFKR